MNNSMGCIQLGLAVFDYTKTPITEATYEEYVLIKPQYDDENIIRNGRICIVVDDENEFGIVESHPDNDSASLIVYNMAIYEYNSITKPSFDNIVRNLRNIYDDTFDGNNPKLAFVKLDNVIKETENPMSVETAEQLYLYNLQYNEKLTERGLKEKFAINSIYEKITESIIKLFNQIILEGENFYE